MGLEYTSTASHSRMFSSAVLRGLGREALEVSRKAWRACIRDRVTSASGNSEVDGRGGEEGFGWMTGSLQSRMCLLDVSFAFRSVGLGSGAWWEGVDAASFFALKGVVVLANCLAATRGTKGLAGSVVVSSWADCLRLRCMIDLLRSGCSATVRVFGTETDFARLIPEVDFSSGAAVLTSFRTDCGCVAAISAFLFASSRRAFSNLSS